MARLQSCVPVWQEIRNVEWNHSYIFTLVQDLAFQLERLIGGMYVYCRQGYNALKPACVFPIEVQLQLEEKKSIITSEEEEAPLTLVQAKKDDDDVPMLDLPLEDKETKEVDKEKREEVADLISI